MIVRQTTPEEARRVNELFAIAFEQPLSGCPADPDHDESAHWAAYTDAGDMMSCITISDFPIRFDGGTCRMGGVGGVSTLPQYRRQGGIRRCFEAALPDLYKKGYDFSYLYPFSTAYYRKFGFESCVQKYLVTIHLGLWSCPVPAGALRLAEGGDALTADLRAIDEGWERHFNMMVQHRPEDYGWLQKAAPAEKQEFTYVWYDGAGIPKGYTTFRKKDEADGRNLVCSRFCFADQEGFYGLMGLFKSLSADHMYVKFTLPVNTAMEYLMPEWSLGAVQWSLRPGGMVRVVNVPAVLAKARYLGDGVVTLKIRDPQIPENNGHFTVTFREGRAVSVAETQAAPDAALSIAAFSALISGVCGLRDAARWFPGLEIREPDAGLDRVFYRKPLFITDYF